AGCTIFAITAGQGFGADLRAALFRKVQALSFGDLDRLETGGLITRPTRGGTHGSQGVMMLLRGLVRVPLLLVGRPVMALRALPAVRVLLPRLAPRGVGGAGRRGAPPFPAPRRRAAAARRPNPGRPRDPGGGARRQGVRPPRLRGRPLRRRQRRVPAPEP